MGLIIDCTIVIRGVVVHKYDSDSSNRKTYDHKGSDRNEYDFGGCDDTKSDCSACSRDTIDGVPWDSNAPHYHMDEHIPDRYKIYLPLTHLNDDSRLQSHSV